MVAEEAAVDEKNNESRLPVAFRILLPILIIGVIAGIFIWKNVQMTSAENAAATDASMGSPVTSDGEDYPLKITSVSLEEVKSYGVPTVVDFGSDSCIPCKEMAPVLETLHAEWQGRAAVQFLDVWKYSDGLDDFPIQVIPTQVFFNADGTPFVPSGKLQNQIAFTMYSSRDTGEHIFTVHQGGITEEQMRLIFAEMGVE
jgi:thioredoxin 1